MEDKMKKKLITLSLICVSIFLVACNNKTKTNPDQTTNNKDIIIFIIKYFVFINFFCKFAS